MEPGQLTMVAITATLTAMGALALVVLRSTQRQVAATQVKLEAIETARQEEMKELHQTLPARYVLKDDYLRTMASVDNKLDNLDRKVDSIVRAVGAATPKGES